MTSNPRLRAFAIAALAAVALPAAALAETVTVTGIEITGGDGVVFAIPTIELTDSGLDEDAVRAMFSSGIEHAAGALATLDAAKIVIPEMTVTSPAVTGTGTAKAVYRNFELTGVVDGVAAAARLDSVEADGGDGTTTSIGAMSTGRFDFGALAAFYGYGDADDTAMKPVYADFALEGIEFSAPNIECRLGPAQAAGFSTRPLRTSYADLIAAAREIEAAEASGDVPASANLATLFAYYADLFTAFRSEPSQVEGIECSGTNPEGKAMRLTSGPLSIGGFEPGVYPAVSLNDFRLEIGDDGWLGFDSLTWKAMDFSDALENLVEAGEAIDEDWLEANWRRIMPALEGFSVTGFGIDIPVEETSGGRVEAGIAALDVTLGGYRNGIPSALSVSGSGIRLPIPGGEHGAALSAMGLESLELGYDAEARWDEASRTIDVDRLSIAGAGLGTIELSGTIGNAGPELFSENHEVARVAALALTLREVTIDLEDSGLTPALIALAAKEQNTPPAAFHVALSGMAQAVPLAVLGATPEALGLSRALGAFLGGTPNLRITLTATDPAGLGLAELMAAQENPALLNGKITIAATASGEPVPSPGPSPRSRRRRHRPPCRRDPAPPCNFSSLADQPPSQRLNLSVPHSIG